jgi:hypothetical protein
MKDPGHSGPSVAAPAEASVEPPPRGRHIPEARRGARGSTPALPAVDAGPLARFENAGGKAMRPALSLGNAGAGVRMDALGRRSRGRRPARSGQDAFRWRGAGKIAGRPEAAT